LLEVVKLFRGREVGEIDWKNASDLYCLSEELKVESLRRLVEDFVMNSNSNSDLLSFVLSLCERGLSTDFLESKLRSEIASLIDEPSFDDVPLSILSRIIDFKVVPSGSSFQKLLKFCVRFVDRPGNRGGMQGAILFRTLELSRLTSSDLGILGDSRKLVYCFMSDSTASSLFDVLGFKSESERRFQILANDISELQTRTKSIEVNCVELSAFQDLCAKVETLK
jgi:hypothetical protein